MTDTNTLDTAVNELADEPETTPATGYTPVFDVRVRTIVYAVAGMLGVIGSCLGVIGAVAGTPAWIAVAGSVLGILGSGTAGVFGVHYAGASR